MFFNHACIILIKTNFCCKLTHSWDNCTFTVYKTQLHVKNGRAYVMWIGKATMLCHPSEKANSSVTIQFYLKPHKCISCGATQTDFESAKNVQR